MNDSIATSENDNTGSAYNHISTHQYTDKDISALAIIVNTLREEVRQLMISKVIETTEAPISLAENTVNQYIAKKYKLGRPPMESEIRDAINKTKDMNQAAEYLGISVFTLKRYCLFFSEDGGAPLWEPRRGSKAIKPLRISNEPYSVSSRSNNRSNMSSPFKDNQTAFGTGSFFNLP